MPASTQDRLEACEIILRMLLRGAKPYVLDTLRYIGMNDVDRLRTAPNIDPGDIGEISPSVRLVIRRIVDPHDEDESN